MNRSINLLVLLALLVILGATFYQFVAPFLLPLFLAAVLAIVCQPVYVWLLQRCGPKRRWLAAGLTTGGVELLVLIPALIGTMVAATQLVSFTRTYLSAETIADSRLWKDMLEPALAKVTAVVPPAVVHEPNADVTDIADRELTEAPSPAPAARYTEIIRQQVAANAESVAKSLAGTTLQLASSTVGAFVSLTIATGMLLLAFFFFLQDGPELIVAAEELIPVPLVHQRELCQRFTKVTRAVVLATFLAAFAQGIATALALQVLGFGHFLVFLAVSTISALVPVAGTWIVWVPCAAWLAMHGHWGAAVGLTVWGAGVVGVLDNVVRTYVLQSDAELHPLVAFVSVLGALQVMGLWGIFVGPIVASCFTALLQIFNQELKDLAQDSTQQAAAAPMPTVTLMPTASVVTVPPSANPVAPALK
ncbi:MAG: AI-2E family transporter [Planctomycetaceae bacterium]|nr:AI-2E family transporter [Planctomycetaceae bacterium]